MLELFNTYISKHQLIEPSEKILVGVSGGIDSIVLSHILKKLGYNFSIAHCNFQLRGKEADKDEGFVKTLARNLNVTCFTQRFNTQEFAQKKGISIQMAARDLRFSWFNELCETHGFSKIAIASNLDDSIETCLINLTKGTGIKGLHGIKPMVNNVIHPLLFATKKEIIDYSTKNNISFREDQSNNETKYIRNKIRHKVVPVLSEINPSLHNTFNSFFNRINECEKLISNYVEAIKKEFVIHFNDRTEIDLFFFNKTTSPKLILFELLSDYGFNEDQIEQLIESLENQPGKVFISSNYKLVTSNNKLTVYPIDNNVFNAIEINEKDLKILSPVLLSISYTSPKIIKNNNVACLDKSKLTFPLLLRKWEVGDKFKPLGLKGTKKLSDFFTDNKLSIFEKENTFVITSNQKIVWIVGYRIDDRYKVTNKTTEQLTIQLIENE